MKIPTAFDPSTDRGLVACVGWTCVTATALAALCYWRGSKALSRYNTRALNRLEGPK
jgi:tRNA G26 N,N-dimethylase Trm1